MTWVVATVDAPPRSARQIQDGLFQKGGEFFALWRGRWCVVAEGVIKVLEASDAWDALEKIADDMEWGP